MKLFTANYKLLIFQNPKQPTCSKNLTNPKRPNNHNYPNQLMSDAQTQIKSLHAEIMASQKKKKEIMAVLKDAFASRKEYHDLIDQINQLKARKKEIENVVRGEYSHEYNELDDIKMDIKD